MNELHVHTFLIMLVIEMVVVVLNLGLFISKLIFEFTARSLLKLSFHVSDQVQSIFLKTGNTLVKKVTFNFLYAAKYVHNLM